MIAPATLEEACAAFRDLRPANLRGAGSKLAHMPADARTVSLAQLSGVVEYRPADLYVTVLAGTPLATIDTLVAGDGLLLPIDAPRHAGRATVGGAVAAGDVGPRIATWGLPRDQVLGARIILGDGTLIRSGGRVLKNAAGYALHRLLAGSAGRLGAYAELTLRLRPRPTGFGMVRAVARDEADAEAISTDWLRGPTRPCLLSWRRDAGPIELFAGFADEPAAIAWQEDELNRARPIERFAEPAARALEADLREFGATADFWAALPGSRCADLFRQLGDSGAALVAHGAGVRVLIRTKQPESRATAARIVQEIGGRLLWPRAAVEDHTAQRVALRTALRIGAGA